MKILLVLDGTLAAERSNDEIDTIMRCGVDVLQNCGADVDVEVYSKVTSDCDAQTLMSEIDKESAQLCIDDYDCVISEGVAAWFWLQSYVELPIICINPIVEPWNTFGDSLDDYSSSSFRRIFKNRGFRRDDVVCVVSAENDEEYECFTDEQLVFSDEMMNCVEFWEDVATAIEQHFG